MTRDYDDAKLIEDARAYVDEVWDDVVAHIDELVRIHSVEDKSHAQEGMPFGPGPKQALDCALNIAGELGLVAHDCEGYVGYGELVGASSDYLATIAHSDIVPLGEGWTVDPLRVTKRDGYLLGRGVIDDKGPLVISLYAAHFFVRTVRKTGLPLPYTLRCIVGTNEETTMADVDYYLLHNPQPRFCFTPDAMFPLICGEKGRVYAEVEWTRGEDDGARIVELAGGTVSNAVPGSARAVVRARASELSEAAGIAVRAAGSDERDRELCEIVATGKGGHAAMPEQTNNAIGVLVDYLLQNEVCSTHERRFLEFEHTLLADTAGRALGIDATDDVFDPLTCVGGTVATMRDDGGVRFVQTMDVRYPKSTTGRAIVKRVGEVAASFGCNLCASEDVPPFYMDPASFEVRTLLDAYNEITNRSEQAFTIGGGTYARHFDRAVAFGPLDESRPKPDWVGEEHGPDEGVEEEQLKRALVIYIVAIARLMQQV